MNNRIKEFAKSKAFSSFRATLLAIILGLAVGFVVMLVANPANALTGFGRVLTAGTKRIGDIFF